MTAPMGDLPTPISPDMIIQVKPVKVQLWICEICGKPTGITVTPDWFLEPNVSYHVHDECIGQLARKHPESFTIDSPVWKAEHPE